MRAPKGMLAYLGSVELVMAWVVVVEITVSHPMGVRILWVGWMVELRVYMGYARLSFCVKYRAALQSGELSIEERKKVEYCQSESFGGVVR